MHTLFYGMEGVVFYFLDQPHILPKEAHMISIVNLDQTIKIARCQV